MEILTLRNAAVTIYFPMINRGAQDFDLGDWTPVAADTKYSVDGGAFANTTNPPAHEGQGIWSLVLTAGEVNGKRTAISIIDSATKSVEDQALIISTFGDATAAIETLPADVKKWLTVAPSALVSGRVDTSVGAMAANVVTAAAIAANALTAAKIATNAIGASQLAADAALEIVDAMFQRDMDQVEGGAAIHSLCTAVLKAVSRVRDNSGVEETYKTDGVTIMAQRTLTADPTNQPIDEAAVATA